ncbi:hypothetical protein MCUN1_003169 [Malassezia cuniculi]|uniref:histidine kinase n=1 Tax=Malassezia cuniculi TaxID=948313 RepID=A0AAF0EWF5_9BASI|nr:hypothetical protein MCUN1_003169 [Malassezia cuniculi]
MRPPYYDAGGQEVTQDQAHVTLFDVSNLPDAPQAVAHALYLKEGSLMVIHDTSRDWRFAAQGKAQFIACAPLIYDGIVLGSLAVWDDEPRAFFDTADTLQELAHVAIHELEFVLDIEQLKQRDAMNLAVEQFTRHFLFIESDRMGKKGETERYEHIYEYAANTIRESLDLDGAIMIDLSGFSLLEEAHLPPRGECLAHAEMQQFCDLLRTSQQGDMFIESIPQVLAKLLPDSAHEVLYVPIFGIGRQPFCLLLGYCSEDKYTPVLDQASAIALQHVRSMGYMMLYVVLQHTVVLADRAKSFFISNMSHELRTPLHGILASTEMLQDTSMNAMQVSFVDTVEACGKGLLELVNHVLDYTKLQGGKGGQGAITAHSDGDLVKLIQEVCDSSWVGIAGNKPSDGIGSVYAPTDAAEASPLIFSPGAEQVELVVDIAREVAGWAVRFDSGGLRRVVMNLVGNALKFTTNGYVRVSLEQVPGTGTKKAINLSVRDTGCGMSKEFLEKKLFQPFSQENPMRIGTGLGLSIVKSIVESMIQGHINVWSEVGHGTHINITFELEEASGASEGTAYKPALSVDSRYTVHMIGFDLKSRGQNALAKSVRKYLERWWKFSTIVYPLGAQLPEMTPNDILLVNEDVNLLVRLMNEGPSYLPPAIVATFLRHDKNVRSVCSAYHAAGGLARVMFKPLGPSRLEVHLDFVVQYLERTSAGDPPPRDEIGPLAPLPSLFESAPTMVPLEGLSNIARAPAEAIVEAPGGAGIVNTENAPTAYAYVEKVLHNDGVVECSLSFTTSTADTPPPAANTGRPLRPARSMTYSEPRLEDYLVSAPIRSQMWPRQNMPPLDPINVATEGKLADAPPCEPGAVSAAVGAAVSAAVNAATVNGPGAFVNVRAIVAPETVPGTPLATATVVSVQPVDSSPSGSSVTLPSPVELAPGIEPQPASKAATTKAATSESVPIPISPVTPTDTHPGGGKSALSCSPARASQAQSQAQSQQQSQPSRVLFVDDNAVNRQVLAAYLRKIGLEHEEAIDGVEGVAAFEKKPPGYFSLVVMDLTMPNMDGVTATSEIRRIERSRQMADPTVPRIPVHMLSGVSSSEDQRHAFAAGADGFLQKPLSFRVFLSLVKSICASAQVGACT